MIPTGIEYAAEELARIKREREEQQEKKTLDELWIVDPGTEALRWARRYDMSRVEAEELALEIERDLQQSTTDKVVLVHFGPVVSL